MQISDASRVAIENCFASIGGVKSFNSFGRLNPDQRKCQVFVKENRQSIYSVRSRDVHLPELIIAISDVADDEDGEPITEATFSQFRFYLFYIHELKYFPEKFDFLLRCIEEAVVVVKAPTKFLFLMERMLNQSSNREIPDGVINYERLIEEDEEERIDKFILRKNWVTKVPRVEDVRPED